MANKNTNLGGAASPLPATPTRNRTNAKNQSIRKNSTIPQSNFYSSWGPTPEFPSGNLPIPHGVPLWMVQRWIIANRACDFQEPATLY